jgi:hypothetical protein
VMVVSRHMMMMQGWNRLRFLWRWLVVASYRFKWHQALV